MGIESDDRVQKYCLSATAYNSISNSDADGTNAEGRCPNVALVKGQQLKKHLQFKGNLLASIVLAIAWMH